MKNKATFFQQLVWDEIQKIPKGETRTYKELAIAVGKPNASRAVALACSKNPHPVTIPCHRVICSDGRCGGYTPTGGESQKRLLLNQEGVFPK